MPRGCFCTLIFLDRFEEGLLVGSGSGKGGSSWSEDSPSVGSSLLARLPCLELLWTNMLSDTASWGPSTETCVEITTWNLLMSRGFPAFLRQFWLHFRKNLRKYRSMITGSEGVSFLLPQLFLSQHRLRLWQTKGEKQNRKKSVTLFLRKKKDLTRTFLKALVWSCSRLVNKKENSCSGSKHKTRMLLLTCTWLREWGVLDTFQGSCPVLRIWWLVELRSQSVWRTDSVLVWLLKHTRVAVDSGYRCWSWLRLLPCPFRWIQQKPSFRSLQVGSLCHKERSRSGRSYFFADSKEDASRRLLETVQCCVVPRISRIGIKIK